MTLGLASPIRAGAALGGRGFPGLWTPGPHLLQAELQGEEAPGPAPCVHPALSESTALPHSVSTSEETAELRKFLYLDPGSRPQASPKPGPR